MTATRLDAVRNRLDREQWRRGCTTTERGGLQATVHNVAHILREHPAWQGTLAYDEFAQQIVLHQPPPWGGSETTWTNALTSELLAWLSSREVGLAVGEGVALSGVLVAARRASFHPLRDYLTGLEWDGTARLAAFMADYFRTDQNAYTSRLGTNWLVSMVARALRPGCKVDTMPVLQGTQGQRKTSALMLLAGREYYAEATAEVGTPAFLELLPGVWLMEFSDLEGMVKSEAGALKKMLSSPQDRRRPPYGRHAETYPRTCVMVGTTNEDAFLRDPTGARRYWPVRVGDIDIDALTQDRDQLWAEAVTLYQHGDPAASPGDVDHGSWCWWWMPPETVEEQADRYQSDPWELLIKPYLDGQGPAERYPGAQREVRFQVGALELMECALRLKSSEITPQNFRRVGQVMHALRWARERVRVRGEREYVYRRFPGGGYTPPEGALAGQYHLPPGMSDAEQGE